ncbi:MAG: LuxR C-terminal-related transcriptional regulator [Marinifilum sp.]|jgi:PAS domain S-box-containing protein|nr:LuxR C-terminal-related transcriptional regulator [Marinifilum sp.]
MNLANQRYQKLISDLRKQDFDPKLPQYIDDLYPHYEIKNTLAFPNQYFYIIRATDGKFIYVSPSVEKITGYRASEFTSKLCLENVHPDEQEILYRAIGAAYKLGQSLDHEEKKHLSFQLNYRLKRKNGQYFHQLRHSTYIRTDRQGHLVYSLSLCTDISGLQFDNQVNIKIFTDDKIFFSLSNNHIQERLQRLSGREKEIVKLLCKNYTSKIIADSLFISRHTVDTHRRNILKKLEITDTRQIYFFQYS